MIQPATQETNLSSLFSNNSNQNTKSKNHKKTSSGIPASSLYFKEMGCYSTLSAEEELFLGRQIRFLRISMWKNLLTFNQIRKDIVERLTGTYDAIPFTVVELLESTEQSSKNINLETKAALSITRLDIDESFLNKILQILNQKYFKEFQKTEAYKELNILKKKLKKIKNQFITANLRLVVAVAKKYSNGPMNLIDLIQEGNIGLIKAVDRFDPEKGYRFSTYAAWWIRHAVSRASADKGRTVRIPVHFIETYQQFKKIRKQLELELNRAPNNFEIADKMGIPVKKVVKIQQYMLEGSMSLDRQVNHSDSRTFLEMLEDHHFEKGISEILIKEKTLKVIFQALNHVLSDIEKDIIDKRFGLSEDKELTLREIGAEYGLSRERIRQIQEKALRKLRSFLSEKEIIL